jgi:hypothetical protein
LCLSVGVPPVCISENDDHEETPEAISIRHFHGMKLVGGVSHMLFYRALGSQCIL